MMLTGYICFVATDRLLTTPSPLSLWCIGGQLTMLGNLWEGLRPAIWPGPYWYFGLMVQLYVVYRLVLFRGRGSIGGRLSGRAWTAMAVTLMLATLLAQWALEPDGAAMEWYRYNCLGSLPVFIAALLWTRRPLGAGAGRTACALTAVVATALVVLLSLTFWTWVLVPFAACAAAYALVRCLPERLLSPLVWLGGISAAMFVCHPITRIIFISISREGSFYGGLLLYIVATVVLAILFRKAIAEVTRACTQ